MGLLDALFDPSTYNGGGLLGALPSFADRFNAVPNAPQPFVPSGRSFDQGQFSPAMYAGSSSPFDTGAAPLNSPGLPSQFMQQPAPAPQSPVVAADDSEDAPAPPAQAGPISVGGYQMPRIGDASAFTPQPPAVAPQAPQPAPAQATPGFSDNLRAGFANLNSGGNPISALANVIDGFATGTRYDKAGVAQQQQAKQMGFAANALLQKGVDPVTVQAAVANPEIMKVLIAQHFGPQTVTALGDGYVADRSGNIKRAYTPEQKDNFVTVQTGEDAMGTKQFSKMNKATGEMTPIAASDGAAGSGGLGDMTKTGADYLATLPPLQKKIVAGMVDGTVQPPSSFALAKKSWQAMLAAAKNVDPSFDENTWTARHKMTGDIAASGNSSMGGILSNGKSSFKHLAEFTDSAADLGNASHNFIGGGALAHAQNYIGNSSGGSDTFAKIKAINDNLGHYGQESTKFYSGTGGGAEERMNALKEINPTTVSSAEMAAYAAKEKGLMLDRLREKETQIRSVMGDAYLQQHPVFTPELQADIARIDANVAKMRGENAGKPATVMQNGHTYTLQPDGSYK